MRILRVAIAFLLSVVVTFTLASVFYTQQVLAKQAAIGAVYTSEQQIATYAGNFIGLAPAYGVVITIALALGFVIAFGVKRVVTPLSPVAYPIAGALAIFAAIYLIENVMAAGGAGAIGGARGGLGLALQCFAGFIGGGVFAFTRGVR